MKIAIQLYGNLRTFQICAPSLNRMIRNYNESDLFIHTWKELEHNTKSSNDHRSITLQKTDINEDTLKKAIEILSPIKIRYEKQQEFIENQIKENKDKTSTLIGRKCMLHSLRESNQLRIQYEKEKNIKYDFVIVTRPDIMFLEPLKIIEFAKLFETEGEKSIHIIQEARIKQTANSFFFLAFASDVIFISKPDTINKISNFYSFFETHTDFFHKNVLINNKNPELQFDDFIQSQGIKQYFLKKNYIIKREKNEHDICRISSLATFQRKNDYSPDLHLTLKIKTVKAIMFLTKKLKTTISLKTKKKIINFLSKTNSLFNIILSKLEE
jgi:hypothetical protein